MSSVSEHLYTAFGWISYITICSFLEFSEVLCCVITVWSHKTQLNTGRFKSLYARTCWRITLMTKLSATSLYPCSSSCVFRTNIYLLCSAFPVFLQLPGTAAPPQICIMTPSCCCCLCVLSSSALIPVQQHHSGVLVSSVNVCESFTVVQREETSTKTKQSNSVKSC